MEEEEEEAMVAPLGEAVVDSEAGKAAAVDDEASVAPLGEAVVESEAAVAVATAVEDEAMVAPLGEAVVESKAAGAAATTSACPVGPCSAIRVCKTSACPSAHCFNFVNWRHFVRYQSKSLDLFSLPYSVLEIVSGGGGLTGFLPCTKQARESIAQRSARCQQS